MDMGIPNLGFNVVDGNCATQRLNRFLGGGGLSKAYFWPVESSK